MKIAPTAQSDVIAGAPKKSAGDRDVFVFGKSEVPRAGSPDARRFTGGRV
ncbi:MAG: hypothetical protein IK090_06855 [Clostridia bacterium]|nr:hypothetical protein [Clostridia bacterium]